MNFFFANRRRTLLIGGVVNLVIPSIMVVALLGSPLELFAKPLVTVEQEFKAFCKTFLDGASQKKDLATCKAMSGSFANVLPKDAQSLWPNQSLKQLALKNELGLSLNTHIKFQQAWVKQIKDKIQQALIKNDKGLMPTLWKYSSGITIQGSRVVLDDVDIEEDFNAFCEFYYSDEGDPDVQENDVETCQGISGSFAIVAEDAQGNWPDQSLKQLALDGIGSEEDFKQALLDEIGDDEDQKALIEQDKDFIPTLFEFESIDSH